MKTTLKTLGYIVAFLLAAAGLIAIVLHIMDIDIPAAADPTTPTLPVVEQTVEPTATPAPTPTAGMSSVSTPYVSNVTPPAAATPTPTPTPTPAPTPTPQPTGLSLGSGSFKSDTGLWINTTATWSAKTISSTHAEVTVKVALASYSLQLGEGNRALVISLGDQSASATVPALNLETDKEVTTDLGTVTFTVAISEGQTVTLPLSAVWHFGGTYSGQDLPTVTCGGDITLKR